MEHGQTLRTAGAKAYTTTAGVLCAVFVAITVWTVATGRFSIFPALGAIGTALLVVRGTAGSAVTVAGGTLVFLHRFRTRRIPVPDVAELVVKSSSGWQRVFVVLRDGRRLPLPAPGGWWPARDPDFKENVRTLQDALGLADVRSE